MKFSIFDLLVGVLLPALILLHLYISPYTKVEESFNLQAIHDILVFGIPTKDVNQTLRSEYDHFSFPGAVPRTFLGSLVLAGVSRPAMWLVPHVNPQLVVRGVLGLFNAFALLRYRDGVSKAFGRSTGNWYLILQASQFHIIYYASRTLPNMFAFGLSTLALRGFLPIPGQSPSTAQKQYRLSIYLLTFSAVVFRSELAILLFTIVSYHVCTRNLSIGRAVLPAGLLGAAVGLLISVPVDTFFWQTQTALWPEMYSFVYNVVQGQSSSWGISPWHFYFTSAIPRLLLNPMSLWVLLPLPLLMPATRPAALSLAIPSLAFILIYSLQPHKEWRFIVYAIPSLTTVSAIGANWIWTRRTKTASYRILSLLLLSSTLASFGASTAMAGVSSLNYPGGHALARLHQIAHGSRKIINIHMDTLSCSTGVTRFYQMPPPTTLLNSGQSLWVYDKSEDEQSKLDPQFWNIYSYVLAERPEKVIGSWEIVETIDGFAAIGLAKERIRDVKLKFAVNDIKSSLKSLEHWVKKNITNGWWPRIKMEPRIHIMKQEEGPVLS